MRLSHTLHALAVVLTLLSGAAGAHAGPRVDAIRSRGHLVCGVAPNVRGFSQQQANGEFTGFEVDLCRAIAAALLGASTQVRFQAIDTVHEFLADSGMDIVFHRLTWTLTREAPGQLEFGPIVLLDEPQSVSKEPLAPMLRSDDVDFTRIVRWTLYALMEAEEYGLRADNVLSEGRRFGWPAPDTGMALGLPADWARRVVAQVGNYGEIYERHLGQGSALAVPRGRNRLWRDGGLLYAPPLR